MQSSEQEKLEFSVGDVVLHRDWGVGYVVEVGGGSSPDIVVDFRGKPQRRMSSGLASRVLSKLPAAGLEALLLKQPEKVARWSKEAPLKLVGAALADLGGAAKPSSIRAKLDGRHLLPVKWESWWKRAQPVVKESPYFHVLPDGSYRLVSALDEIPETPFPPSPKKTRVAKVGKAEVQAIVSRLEAGEMEFEDLRGAKILHLVAEEIVQRREEYEWAGSSLQKALAGPTVTARVILDAILKLGKPEEMIEALAWLTGHIQTLAATSSMKQRSKTSEYIMAKLRLLRDITERLPGSLEPVGEKGTTLVRDMLQLALIIWRKEVAGWRLESLGYISRSIVNLAKRQLDLFAIVGEHLARLEANNMGKVAIADTLLATVEADVRPSVMDKLLMGSLVQPSEFAEECFLRHLKKEQQLPWISSALYQVLLSYDTLPIESLSKLLLRKSTQLEPQELKTFVELAIIMVSVRPQMQALLCPVMKNNGKKWLDSVISQVSELTMPIERGSILEWIGEASQAIVQEERDKAKQTKKTLESQIKSLQLALETAEGKSAKLEKMVEQLQSSYRMPEQWASFQGKQDVLNSLAALYQEAFRSGADVSLIGLENVFQTHGLSRFGKVGSSETFDPSLHEFIPGFVTAGKEIIIKCPGLELHDPAGNRVILARAKVVRP